MSSVEVWGMLVLHLEILTDFIEISLTLAPGASTSHLLTETVTHTIYSCREQLQDDQSYN